MRRATTLCLLLVLSGCTRQTFRSRPLDNPAPPARGSNSGSPTEVQYAASLGVNLAEMTRTPTGLYWKDLAVGTGAEAVNGSTVVMDYTGWLPDARKFDSSKDSGKPYTFVLGEGNAIAGWDQGIPGMRVGGRRLLVIPPQLGYGSSGMGGVIPPSATLVFNVELRNVAGQGAAPAAR